MMRKHLNSIHSKDLQNIPFYPWQCLTIQLPSRDIDLVIESEDHMKTLIQFFILSLNSVDGVRNSAEPVLKAIFEEQTKGKVNQQMLYESTDAQLSHLKRVNMQCASDTAAKKYQLLKYRMKIGFMAFTKSMTVNELFLRTIQNSYEVLKRDGLIKNPWPKPNKNMIKIIMQDEFVVMHDIGIE